MTDTPITEKEWFGHFARTNKSLYRSIGYIVAANGSRIVVDIVDRSLSDENLPDPVRKWIISVAMTMTKKDFEIAIYGKEIPGMWDD